jgi:WD40 repeat protein
MCTFAQGLYGGELFVWDINSMTPSARLAVHLLQSVQAVGFSRDAELVAVCGESANDEAQGVTVLVFRWGFDSAPVFCSRVADIKNACALRFSSYVQSYSFSICSPSLGVPVFFQADFDSQDKTGCAWVQKRGVIHKSADALRKLLNAAGVLCLLSSSVDIFTSPNPLEVHSLRDKEDEHKRDTDVVPYDEKTDLAHRTYSGSTRGDLIEWLGRCSSKSSIVKAHDGPISSLARVEITRTIASAGLLDRKVKIWSHSLKEQLHCFSLDRKSVV